MTVQALLAEGGHPLRLTEISRRCALAKSTTHRILAALLDAGLVTRAGNGYRAVGSSVPTWEPWTLRWLAPFVGDLYAQTRLTTRLAVLDGDEVVYPRQVHGHDDVWTRADESGRASALRTAAGWALLAADPRAMSGDEGLDPDEFTKFTLDLARTQRAGFAARDHDGVASLAIAVPGAPGFAFEVKGRAPLPHRDRVLFHLRATARAATVTAHSAHAS
ncbi:helix-turn-helix domain-containing protein [Amycolatopsis sp. NPDC004368]